MLSLCGEWNLVVGPVYRLAISSLLRRRRTAPDRVEIAGRIFAVPTERVENIEKADINTFIEVLILFQLLQRRVRPTESGINGDDIVF